MGPLLSCAIIQSEKMGVSRPERSPYYPSTDYTGGGDGAGRRGNHDGERRWRGLVSFLCPSHNPLLPGVDGRLGAVL